MTARKLAELLLKTPDATVLNPYWEFPCPVERVEYTPPEDDYEDIARAFPKGVVRLA